MHRHRTLLVTAALAMATTACGGGSPAGEPGDAGGTGASTSASATTPTVEEATSSTTGATSTSASSTSAEGAGDGCTAAGLAAFADVMADLGIAYDYAPSASVADLTGRADIVVTGGLRAVDADGDQLLFTVEVDDLVAGTLPEPASTLSAAVDFVPSARGVDEVRDAMPSDADGVLFLVGDDEDPTRWFPLLEGMWLACDGTVTSLRAAPTWEVDSLDELVDAVRAAG
ncbi:MAG: hypothetical protein S0880_10090 [Actinomycetota bacterium]|nr:hypothetical protein [Actinomycetota bacterium]